MNTISKKSRMNKILFTFGLLFFIVVQFIIIPIKQTRQDQIILNQNDSLTHNLDSIIKYKNPYIGNFSNTANLFYHLPLNKTSLKFHIHPKDCSLTVYYLDTVEQLGNDKVQRDLIYNSVASMALIQNLSKITYEFTGKTFIFTRDQITSIYGKDLPSLIMDKKKWQSKVQTKLNDSNFVNHWYNR